jgi:predicted nucleic acid-binding protein
MIRHGENYLSRLNSDRLLESERSMYLWDTNIVRHFGEGHPNLRLHLEKISWSEIALPSVVIAEILRGRSEYALKAPPEKLPFAHEQLFRTQKFLTHFNAIIFDEVRLSKAFNTTPELWLNLQQNYDLWYASQESDDWKMIETITM